MQTTISKKYQQTAHGKEAESILRACVHCGFCTATCPTYQLLGDELDGPRGRIYQIKQVLEGAEPTDTVRQHLDLCLTCRSCETTCPSGVQYGRLVDIGREIVEQETERSFTDKAMRSALRHILPYPNRTKTLMGAGYLVKNILPAKLTKKLPPQQGARKNRWAVQAQARKVLAFDGCVQSVVTPSTNAATARVLEKLGIELVKVEKAGCCGAVDQHLSAPESAKDFMRRNIDAWWPPIEAGAEAIAVTASGCGVMIKDYGHLLKDDPDYADKAERVSALAKDISEILRDTDFSTQNIEIPAYMQKVAFHSPCTLQHGQQLNGVVEGILSKAGFTLTPVTDAHLCCGSAGTYSILQPELSQQLLNDKLQALQTPEPDIIATANIGCQMHLGSAADKKVLHWIELLDEVL